MADDPAIRGDGTGAAQAAAKRAEVNHGLTPSVCSPGPASGGVSLLP